MTKPVYDTREKLQSCEFKHLDRRIGIAVFGPIEHVGMEMPTVEVHRETISINTSSSGRLVAATKWVPETAEAIRKTIDELQVVIVELTAHEDHLENQLKVLAFITQDGASLPDDPDIVHATQYALNAISIIAKRTSDIIEKAIEIKTK